MINLRCIIENLYLQFKYGDSETLKFLMLKNDNEFFRFQGEDQFLKKVKVLYPNIEACDLYEDFLTNMRICYSIRNFCRDYFNHGERMVIQFHYEESVDEKSGKSIGENFKLLNGVTRPASDRFWDVFLPPNHVGDNCSVRSAYKDDITPIPLYLPCVEARFVHDLNGLLLGITSNLENHKSNSIEKTAVSEWNIDLRGILLDACCEVFQEDTTNLTNTDREYFKRQIDDILGKV